MKLITGIFLLIIFFTGPIFLQSQSSKITGSAPDYLHQKVRLFTYGDHFTKNLVPIDFSEVDGEGNFSFKVDFNQMEFVNLRVGWVNAQFYVEPGSDYKIIFPEKPFDVPLNLTPACKVDIVFEDLPKNDFNYLLASLNNEMDAFFESHQNFLSKLIAPRTSSPDKEKITSDTLKASNTNESKLRLMMDSLRLKLDLLYEDIDHLDFQQQVKMVIADLEKITRDDRKYLFDNYIDELPLTLHLPEYCNFLSSFFNKYFASYAQQFGGEELGRALNASTNHNDLLKVLEKDDFLEKIELREAIASYAIFEVYKNRSLDQKKLIGLLDSISLNAKSKSSGRLANSFRTVLTKRATGYSAPNFELLNLNNEAVSLEDFRGDHVVIEFTADWCKSCKPESLQISKYAEQYGPTIKMVSIYLDDNFDSVQKQYAKYNVSHHTILSGNTDPFLKEKYNILSVPQYFIVTPEGNFMNSFVRKPSEGLAANLHKIKFKEEAKSKEKIKIGEK